MLPLHKTCISSVVPRGIEPRCPGFHSGAYIHSAKAPLCDEYWLIHFSSSPNCIHQQKIYRVVQKIRTSFFRFAAGRIQPCLPARQADEERFELSTNGLTSRRSAVELFIHCWPGETRTLNSRCKRPVL